jgi:hypothetical protein
MERYFPIGTSRDDRGYILGARASIALRILDHFAIIAATDDGEDSAGRHKFKLHEPDALVDRAFDIAHLFVTKAEQLGEIVRPDFDEVAREVGRLHGVQENEKYQLGRRIAEHQARRSRGDDDTTGPGQ